jgi:hypothetical protein
MKTSFIVVDDFYENPDEIVARALALPYIKEQAVNYPGVMAHPFQDVSPLMERFARLLGGIDLKYRGTQGGFRVTTEADLATRTSLVHIDSSDFSAVIHLSQRSAEGTYFYRHKRLGLERVDQTDDPLVAEALQQDTLDLGAWEVIGLVPSKYNRLLLFDGKYFHSGAQRFSGNQLSDGRITQNFFFYRD